MPIRRSPRSPLRPGKRLLIRRDREALDETARDLAWMDHLDASPWTAQGATLRVTQLSERWQNLLGKRRFPQWTKIIYPPDQARVTIFFHSKDPAATGPVEYRLIDQSGELVWVRHWIVGVSSAAGDRKSWTGLLQNITPLKRLERECLHVSERECNRIGQELHDDICQILAGLSYLLQVMGKKVFEALPELRPEFHELNQQLCVGMERTRMLAHGLFPAKLAGIGIKRALQDLAEQTRARFPIQVSVESDRYVPKHSSTQILQLYRIAQEALSNAVKHGKASHARIVLRTLPKAMEISVLDNGVGLPATNERPNGIGMHVMQYRAGLLAGSLNVRPGESGGVEVKLVYPRLSGKDLERLMAT